MFLIYSENVLKYEIHHDQPIDVSTYAESLAGLTSMYTDFVRERFSLKSPDAKDSGLYISRVETGSLITELIDKLPNIQDANALLEFGAYIKKIVESILGKSKSKENKPPNKKALKGIRKLAAPALIGNRNHIDIKVDFKGNTVAVSINHSEAKQIDDYIENELGAKLARIERRPEDKHELREELEPRHLKVAERTAKRLLGSTYKEVVFKWAKGKAKTVLSLRGVVESISEEPLQVVFDNDKLESEMLEISDDNPLQLSYVVDVSVDYSNGKPATYYILKIHGTVGHKKSQSASRRQHKPKRERE